jgi:hypothetical protein
MSVGLLMLLFWLGFDRFDARRHLVAISPKEFNRLLELR